MRLLAIEVALVRLAVFHSSLFTPHSFLSSGGCFEGYAAWRAVAGSSRDAFRAG